MNEILPFAVALFIGLLVGVERERSKGTGPARGEAGSRTFAVACLLGAIAMRVGGVTLLAVVLAAVSALVAVAYFRRRSEDPGLTTEAALLIVVLIGGLSSTEPLLAAALGVTLAIILAAKEPIHTFARNKITQAELRDAFILAFATVIVWPLLPDQPMGPYGAINPFKLWSLVILVMAIGGVGHVATRAIGGRYGLPLSGFASGFASSTATIAAMGQRVRQDRAHLHGAVAGGALSTVATFIQLALVLWVASPQTLFAMTAPLFAGGVVAAAYGAWFTWRAVNDSDGRHGSSGGAISLKIAFALAGTFAVMLMAAAFLRESFGQAGVVGGAALAGVADAHAAAISIAALVSNEKVSPADAVIPILVAVTSNAAMKGVMAFASGAPAYAARIAPGLALSTGAAWLAAYAAS
jgi:uncharacterized membrane protein (DUF4010 family)